MVNDWYSIDHSQDVYIHKTKDGKIFGIKNIRQEFDSGTVTFIADITGDEESAKEYLSYLASGLVRNYD
jgi:hypothetical protein